MTSKSIILTAQNNHVPSKITSKRFNQPWFNRECKRKIRKKARRYKLYKRTKLETDWVKYQEAARCAKKSCTNAYNTYIKETVTENGDKNKKFFSFIKSKRTDISGVSSLIDENNKTVTKVFMNSCN